MLRVDTDKNCYVKKMNRSLQATPFAIWVVVFLLGIAGGTFAQGKGMLNQIDVADVTGIDEILAFNAFEPDPKNGTIRLIFEFADIEHNTGIGPTLIVNRDGERVAHVRPEVFFVEAGAMRKSTFNMIEISLAPKFIRESALLIQFFPSTEKLVTYKISLTAATVLRKENNVITTTPLGDFLNSLPTDKSGTEQGAARNP